MAFITSLFVRRVLPHTLPIITRNVLATGIVGGIYRQPLRTLLPLFINIIRRGDIAWIISPVSAILPATVNLPFQIIKRILLSAVLYRLIANALVFSILYPLKLLLANILLIPTSLSNYDWFKEVNKVIHSLLRSLLNQCIDQLDTIFAFAIDYSWVTAGLLSILTLCFTYYKYESIQNYLVYITETYPNFYRYFSTGIGYFITPVYKGIKKVIKVWNGNNNYFRIGFKYFFSSISNSLVSAFKMFQKGNLIVGDYTIRFFFKLGGSFNRIYSWFKR